MQVVEEHGRDVLRDTSFVHMLCHRPKQALQHLQEMAEGHAMPVDQGVLAVH